MKLTQREKGLWGFVIVAILVMFIFNFVYKRLNLNQEIDRTELEETRRILRSELNIKARSRAVSERLKSLKAKFLTLTTDEAGLVLLEEIEALAVKKGLSVSQKSLLQLSEGVIAVSLEGETDSKSLFSFLHQIANARLGLNVKRLRMHANPVTKTIQYQLIISTLLL
ncbi:MAG TPA: hypothetical protein PLZ08_00530 [Bacillota bacterium]|nr:hypothetical protein [Bacillota bacterium]HOL10802.1 hypothetical protein [Bacillota bacterium]HPO96429.1 hypothetical protein [Bacillota bacterium]